MPFFQVMQPNLYRFIEGLEAAKISALIGEYLLCSCHPLPLIYLACVVIRFSAVFALALLLVQSRL